MKFNSLSPVVEYQLPFSLSYRGCVDSPVRAISSGGINKRFWHHSSLVDVLLNCLFKASTIKCTLHHLLSSIFSSLWKMDRDSCLLLISTLAESHEHNLVMHPPIQSINNTSRLDSNRWFVKVIVHCCWIFESCPILQLRLLDNLIRLHPSLDHRLVCSSGILKDCCACSIAIYKWLVRAWNRFYSHKAQLKESKKWNGKSTYRNRFSYFRCTITLLLLHPHFFRLLLFLFLSVLAFFFLFSL